MPIFICLGYPMFRLFSWYREARQDDRWPDFDYSEKTNAWTFDAFIEPKKISPEGV